MKHILRDFYWTRIHFGGFVRAKHAFNALQKYDFQHRMLLSLIGFSALYNRRSILQPNTK